ncbi:MAG TPA: 1,2-phenylacetyl-CoA epoxidase subunit PaaE [Micromonosporaceae bacterium]|jgi:ring-1,2-phenylacetyl-CoA epoxidase subunit PaaE|nr:1,2-phenylacetyl-CoA epoxidase subunit PaaE [Micromonosporaceae bacterium]
MTVTVTKPVRRRARFHKLRVAGVDQLTDDAVTVSFAVPDELRDGFGFQPGQHVTLRRPGEDDVRRSYSICSTPRELATSGVFRIGVRLVPGGEFSTYLHEQAKPGDVMEVMPPLGHFTTAFHPDRSRHYAGIAAGSGITPVLSLAATALETEPASRVTLLYGNRTASSAMFVEELADLKDRYPARLHLAHVLSREQQESELFSGRLDVARLARIFDVLIAPSQVDEWFLCGPQGLVDGARGLLLDSGVPGDRIHVELFFAEGEEADRRTAAPVAPPDRADSAQVTIILDGRESSFRMARAERVLDAARRVRAEVPFACTGGVCGTCRAKLVVGEVTMARNYALEPDEVAAGYVLTCQSSPVGDTLTVDYDG